MKIRLARDEDTAALARLRRQSIRYINSKDYSPEVIRIWIRRGNTQSMRKQASERKRWVAVEGDQILGFSEHNLVCELSRLYVHKDHLQKGIGSKLLKMAEDSLRKLGCKKVNLNATITAKKFYEKNGYQMIEKIMDSLENEQIEVYRMEKKL